MFLRSIRSRSVYPSVRGQACTPFVVSVIQNSRYYTSKRYLESHEWVAISEENGKQIGTVGISEYAQDTLGDLVFVQLPEIDEEVNKSESFGAVESVKAASELYSPISGRVVEFNEVLEDSPETVNSSPSGEGWMIKVELSNADELGELMDEDCYAKFLEKL